MKLRYYQADAVNAFFQFYANGNVGNPLLAMPTGTGKSLVIACLICEIIRRHRSQRVLMLTHVKELIAQNYATLLRVWPNCPAGIYSAGLDRKDAGFPITYAGIGSIYKKAHIFQKTDIVIIDEAHLLGLRDSAMYRKFLDDLKKFNPYVIVVGLTATPFRLGQGMLTQGENALFTAIAYDLTGIEAFNRLIHEGFLAPLIPLKTRNELDIEGLGITNGDFNISQMEDRYKVDKVVIEALEESIRQGFQRKKWLIFATGVESCHKIANLLNNKYGISARVVHSPTKLFPMTSKERDENIAAFKRGEVRALINNNVLTTGFDDPEIDLIVMLRPTMSPGLWVQMLGRGTRPSPGKVNCLVLDFAGNTKRLGPINDPVIPYPKKKRVGPPREAPVKICDNCGMYNHASVRICSNCGFEFPRIIKITNEASDQDLIKGETPIQIEVFAVKHVSYEIHSKTDKPDSLKVTYECGLRHFKAWQCFEHPEPAAHNARAWWRKATTNSAEDAPKTALEAIVRTGELKHATHIRVRLDTKYHRVMDTDYTGTAFGSIQAEEELPSPVNPPDEDDDIPF